VNWTGWPLKPLAIGKGISMQILDVDEEFEEFAMEAPSTFMLFEFMLL